MTLIVLWCLLDGAARMDREKCVRQDIDVVAATFEQCAALASTAIESEQRHRLLHKVARFSCEVSDAP